MVSSMPDVALYTQKRHKAVDMAAIESSGFRNQHNTLFDIFQTPATATHNKVRDTALYRTTGSDMVAVLDSLRTAAMEPISTIIKPTYEGSFPSSYDS